MKSLVSGGVAVLHITGWTLGMEWRISTPAAFRMRVAAGDLSLLPPNAPKLISTMLNLITKLHCTRHDVSLCHLVLYCSHAIIRNRTAFWPNTISPVYRNVSDMVRQHKKFHCLTDKLTLIQCTGIAGRQLHIVVMCNLLYCTIIYVA